MARKIQIGSVEAHEKLTARLLWRPAGETGYIDAGNVADYAETTTRSLVVRNRSQDGLRTVNDEQSDVDHLSFTFTLDERTEEHERLITLCRSAQQLDQTMTEGATATIESASIGVWHEIGSYNLANVAASGQQSGALTEGDDYEVDLEGGLIKFISGGSVARGETVAISFDRGAIEFQQTTPQSRPLYRADIVIEERNQFSRIALRTIACTAYLNAVEFPVQSGEFGRYKVKATASSRATITKRGPHDALVIPPEDNAPAASSSSSSSSYSSQSSSSSSSTSSNSSSSSYSSQSSSSSSSPSSQSSSSSSTAVSFTSSSSSSSLSSLSSSSSSTAVSLSSSSSSSYSSQSSQAISSSSSTIA